MYIHVHHCSGKNSILVTHFSKNHIYKHIVSVTVDLTTEGEIRDVLNKSSFTISPMD